MYKGEKWLNLVGTMNLCPKCGIRERWTQLFWMMNLFIFTMGELNSECTDSGREDNEISLFIIIDCTVQKTNLKLKKGASAKLLQWKKGAGVLAPPSVNLCTSLLTKQFLSYIWWSTLILVHCFIKEKKRMIWKFCGIICRSQVKEKSKNILVWQKVLTSHRLRRSEGPCWETVQLGRAGTIFHGTSRPEPN